MRRRPLLLGLTATLLGSPRARADALSDGSFQREILDLLGRRHPEWTMAAGPGLDVITLEGSRLYLGNIFAQLRGQTGPARDDQIVAFAETVLSATRRKPDDDSFAAVRPKLQLQLIPADYLRTAPTIVSRPFAAGLAVAYAVDDDKAYAIVQQDKLTQWHIDADELDRQAHENAEAAAARIPLDPRPNPEQGSFTSVATGDGYDAARLILPGFMARLRATLDRPALFAAIPNRDFLVAWTPDFARRKGFAAQVQRDAQSQPHPLTDALFVSSDDGLRLATNAELADHGRPAR